MQQPGSESSSYETIIPLLEPAVCLFWFINTSVQWLLPFNSLLYLLIMYCSVYGFATLCSRGGFKVNKWNNPTQKQTMIQNEQYSIWHLFTICKFAFKLLTTGYLQNTSLSVSSIGQDLQLCLTMVPMYQFITKSFNRSFAYKFCMSLKVFNCLFAQTMCCVCQFVFL